MPDGANPDYRFEIAISFAGDSKRDLVRQVAEILQDKVGEGRVFFDEWFEAELAGPDAQVVLQNIFRKATRLVVTCVCRRYGEKPWTQDEWRAIQAFERNLRDAGSDNVKRMRFLPLRFGDGEVDGLFDNAIVPDVRQRSPEKIADLILARLRLAKHDPRLAESTTEIDTRRVPGEPRGPTGPEPTTGGPSQKAVAEEPSKAQMRSPRSSLRVPTFHFGGVVPPPFFIDREWELAEAEKITRAGQDLLLVGYRRAGKTSFCETLIHRVMGRAGNEVLAGKLNLESCADLTVESFLGHTLLNMVGEISRQVFDCKYADLHSIGDGDLPARLQDDPSFRSFLNIHRLVIERTHYAAEARPSPLVPQEFVTFATDLLSIIRSHGWDGYLIIYDEANRLPTDLSVDLLMSNFETLNSAHLTSAYAASPAMAETFDALRTHLGHQIRLGPFPSQKYLRQLVARYYFGDPERTAELPVTSEALDVVWERTGGFPYPLQCLLGYSFASALESGSVVVEAAHVDEAYGLLRKKMAEYFQEEGRQL